MSHAGPESTKAEPIRLAPRELNENEPQTSGGDPLIRIASESPLDPTVDQRMRIVEVSGTLDFWDRPEEDIYSLEDGDPV